MLTKKSFLNKNPKIIFTSMGHAYDEVFKYYVANKSQNGSKYYVMQHGNKSFVDINSNYVSEFENSDFYNPSFDLFLNDLIPLPIPCSFRLLNFPF